MSEAEKKTILIAENNFSQSTVLSDRFEEMGYEVITASTLATFRSSLDEHNVDMVLLGDLPTTESAHQFLGLIKEAEAKGVPVVAVTVYSKEELGPELAETTAEHVEKPADLDEINTALRRSLRQQGRGGGRAPGH